MSFDEDASDLAAANRMVVKDFENYLKKACQRSPCGAKMWNLCVFFTVTIVKLKMPGF